MTQSTQAPGGSSGWKVTGQVEQTQVQNGSIQPGWRVSFMTGNGAPGSVWLPANQYNPGNVMAAITPVAAQLDAVGGLQVPPGN